VTTFVASVIAQPQLRLDRSKISMVFGVNDSSFDG